jgi:hypothetical protein
MGLSRSPDRGDHPLGGRGAAVMDAKPFRDHEWHKLTKPKIAPAPAMAPAAHPAYVCSSFSARAGKRLGRTTCVTILSNLLITEPKHADGFAARH